MAGEFVIYFDNGQQLSGYTNANAVNTTVRVSMTGSATATSPYIFRVSSDTSIRDIVVTTCDTGYMELIANGQPTGKCITVDQRYVSSIANRRKYVPRYRLKAGVDYTWLVRQLFT